LPRRCHVEQEAAVLALSGEDRKQRIDPLLPVQQLPGPMISDGGAPRPDLLPHLRLSATRHSKIAPIG